MPEFTRRTNSAALAFLVAGAAWFARKLPELRRLIRPIYQRLGILPEIAAGLQSTTALQVPPER